MTSRIPGWGRSHSFVSEGPVRAASVANSVLESVREETVIRPFADENVIDEAFEQVMQEQGINDVLADRLRRLMSTDMRSDVAHAYYTSMADKGGANVMMRGGRKELTLYYVLNEDEMSVLTQYAPEYKLSYRSRDVHDHPLAAASRLIDRDLIYSKLPLSGTIVDVGCAVVPHVAAGLLGSRVHGCTPMVDRKDPSRRIHDDMRVRRIMERTDSQSVYMSAERFLTRDLTAVCGLKVEQCSYKADYITSVHVYDVPIGAWPAIIENHGARLVEGCMLFSPKMFEDRVGVFEAAGARYEVEAETGKFRMGFVGSPAWFYEHDWVEYLKYGVDQILIGKAGAYSYKIVERRGDTIFFRILPVAGKPDPDYKQVYQLPGVPMVDVSGFDLGKSDRPLRSRRKQYMWPMPLWQDMLTHAAVMIERGALDVERMFNHYRTVAPRQTINAVCVAGGLTVDIDELAPLVVHSILAASMLVLKSQTEVNAHIASAMRARASATETTVYKVLAAVGSALKASFGLVCYPLELLSGLVDRASESLALRGLMDWQPQVRIREVSAKLILTGPLFGSAMSDIVLDSVYAPFRDSAPFNHVVAAAADPELAQELMKSFYDVLPSEVLRVLEKTAGVGAVKVEVDSSGKAVSIESPKVPQGFTAPPSYHTESNAGARSSLAEKRRMAVREAIEQCEYEMQAVQASLAKTWRELVPGGKPQLSRIVSREEEYRFPTFWWVEAGVLVHEMRYPNASVDEFEYSAVYLPMPDAETGSFVRPVFEEQFDGMSKGEKVSRTYFKLADTLYTGWALATSATVVYNGPELIASMTKSLDCDFEFSTRLVAGPPGCGKTYQIRQVVEVSDVVFAPVKKVCLDTRKAVASKSAALAAVAKDRCRTVDSYLVNYAVWPNIRKMEATRLLADEAFMAVSGRWYAVAALLGVSSIWFFGDSSQIPPVIRAGAPKFFVRVGECDEEVKLWKNYRGPANSVAAWGSVYDWKVRAVSKFKGELLHVEKASALPQWPGEVMLGFYQADKREIAKLYASRNPMPRIATVHEVQGETLQSVKLHRFDMRRRNDNMALFDQEPYVLVAMSRHKENFAYIGPKYGDLVERWVKRGRDPRRVEAAGDVDTAGISCEFK